MIEEELYVQLTITNAQLGFMRVNFIEQLSSLEWDQITKIQEENARVIRRYSAMKPYAGKVWTVTVDREGQKGVYGPTTSIDDCKWYMENNDGPLYLHEWDGDERKLVGD